MLTRVQATQLQRKREQPIPTSSMRTRWGLQRDIAHSQAIESNSTWLLILANFSDLLLLDLLLDFLVIGGLFEDRVLEFCYSVE